MLSFCPVCNGNNIFAVDDDYEKFICPDCETVFSCEFTEQKDNDEYTVGCTVRLYPTPKWLENFLKAREENGKN